MIDLYKEIDFQYKGTERKDFSFIRILKKVCKEKAKERETELSQIKKPVLENNSDNCIVCLGLPKVSKAKSEKLKLVLEKKIFPKLKISEAYKDLFFEFDEEGVNTTGIAIIEFSNPDKAREASISLDRFILPPKFTFNCMTLQDFHLIFEVQRNTVKSKFLNAKQLTDWKSEDLKTNTVISYTDQNMQV